jgi:menaquinol-cytochrome c reductase iron-sulfur subunit
MSHHASAAPSEPTRRGFFEWLTVLLGAVATLAFAIPFIAFLFGPLLKKPADEWITVGPLSDFPNGETRLATFDNTIRLQWDGMTAHTGVYVRNLGLGTKDAERYQVFAINCAHLGCPVTWFPQSGLFMCPCHGGVYYENGDHASGPPPRGLFQIDWKVAGDKLEIKAPHLPTLQDTLRKNDV